VHLRDGRLVLRRIVNGIIGRTTPRPKEKPWTISKGGRGESRKGAARENQKLVDQSRGQSPRGTLISLRQKQGA